MKFNLYIPVLLLQVSYLVTACTNNKSTVRIAEEIATDSSGVQSVRQDVMMTVDLVELGYEEIELAKAARLRSGNKTI